MRFVRQMDSDRLYMALEEGEQAASFVYIPGCGFLPQDLPAGGTIEIPADQAQTYILKMEEEMDRQLALAADIAKKAHQGQKDKGGQDYFTAHVSVVAKKAGQFGDKRAQAAGYLHDVVEDTPWTCQELVSAGVRPDIAAAVGHLTRPEGADYMDYVEKLRSDPIAAKVKLADLANNMNLSRLGHEPTDKDRARADKYRRALVLLMYGFRQD